MLKIKVKEVEIKCKNIVKGEITMENNEKMIDKIIQNSYNDIQVPHNMFEDIYDNIEENTKQSKLMYISIAAAILVIVLIAIFAIFNTKQNVNDDESTTILNLMLG